jgi:hypothetical protein
VQARGLVREGKRIEARLKKEFAEVCSREAKLKGKVRDKAMKHLLLSLPRLKWRYNATWPALEAAVPKGLYLLASHCFFKYAQPIKGYHGLKIQHRNPSSLLIVTKTWDVAQLIRFAIDHKLKVDWDSIRLTSSVLKNTLELIQDLEQSTDGRKPVKLRRNSAAMKEVCFLVDELTRKESQ